MAKDIWDVGKYDVFSVQCSVFSVQWSVVSGQWSERGSSRAVGESESDFGRFDARDKLRIVRVEFGQHGGEGGREVVRQHAAVGEQEELRFSHGVIAGSPAEMARDR